MRRYKSREEWKNMFITLFMFQIYVQFIWLVEAVNLKKNQVHSVHKKPSKMSWKFWFN